MEGAAESTPEVELPLVWGSGVPTPRGAGSVLGDDFPVIHPSLCSHTPRAAAEIWTQNLCHTKHSAQGPMGALVQP